MKSTAQRMTLQSANSFFVITLAPVFAAVWMERGPHQSEARQT
jgi:dipeptide/tripeptide permease